MHCDVAVVGAGPAGASCAYLLARAGYDVTVIERARFPRSKVCGEYLSAATCAQLAQIGAAQTVRAGAAQIRRIRLHTHGLTVELPLPTAAWSIARADLDAKLFSHALGAGVKHRVGRVERIERLQDGARLMFRGANGFEESLHARMVVGADGAGSVVARAFNLCARVRGERRFALGGHYCGFGALDQTIEMYVRGQSYVAVNPLGERLANVMVIVGEKKLHEWRGAIDERLQHTARELAAGRRDAGNVRLVGKRIAVGPLAHRTRAAAAPGVFLVGDAAGFLDPFTGQGVFLALKSAALAAKAIASESASAYKTYDTEHRSLFASRQRVATLVSMLVKTPGLSAFAAHTLRRNSILRERLMQAVAGAV